MFRPGLGHGTSRLTLEQLEERTLLNAAPITPPLDDLVTIRRVPNDPQFVDQYALNNTGQNGGTANADIQATEAWDVTTGSRKIGVAVVDTGIDYEHPDLYQNIWLNVAEIPLTRKANLLDADGDGILTFADLQDARNQGTFKIRDLNGNKRIDGGDVLKPMVKDAQGRDTGEGGWADGISQEGDSYVDDLIGWNFYSNTNNPMDDNGHGTNVAGVIGAMGNNGDGVTGVVWQTSLMPLKFLNAKGSGSTTRLIEALNYAIAKGAKITNNSWGNASNSAALLNVLNAGRAAGQIFVAAAGNDRKNIDTTADYPTSYKLDNMVSVAATDRNDNLADFSSWGANSVALAAAGVEIVSTYPGKSYNITRGTSLAAPQVAGVLALVWGQHPDWTYQQVIQQVLNTVDKVPSLQGKTMTGGRLNAAAAVGWTPPALALSPRILGNALLGTANTISTMRVTFSKGMLTNEFSPADVWLCAPNGQRIAAQSVKVVAGSSNTVFDILFPTQTVGGDYSLKIGPEVFDTSWNKMTVYQTSFTLSSTTAPAVVSSAVEVTPRILSNALLGTTNTISTLRVTFSKAMLTNEFSPADVWLYAPSGQRIAAQSVKVVAGTGNTVFDILFPTQTASGVYNLKIGPEVFDIAWNKMTIYQTSVTLGATAAEVVPPAAEVTPRIIGNALLGTANTLSTIRVTFSKAMLTNEFSPADVWLYAPSGQRIAAQSVKVVAGSGNMVFDILFPTQTAGGVYNLKIGPEVFDTSWTKMTVYQTSFTL